MSGIVLFSQHDGTITRASAKALRAHGVPATGTTTVRAAKAAAKKAGVPVTVRAACPTPARNTKPAMKAARKSGEGTLRQMFHDWTAAQADAQFSL